MTIVPDKLGRLLYGWIGSNNMIYDLQTIKQLLLLLLYLYQECTRVAKERITQSLQQVQTTIERSKVEEMFRESSQQLKALEVSEYVNAEFIMSFPSFLYYFCWTDFPLNRHAKGHFCTIGLV